MRIALLVVVAGFATAPPRHAETYLRRGFAFQAPREITVTQGYYVTNNARTY